MSQVAGPLPGSEVAAATAPLAIIRSRIHTLPDRERLVADFALQHGDALLDLSVTQLASRLGVSDATIVRFCQRLGYRGYHEFKILLARSLGGESAELYSELAADDDAATVLRKTTHLSIQALQDTLSTLSGAELERASQALLGARMVVLFGVGGSGGIAIVALQRLLRVGVRAFACIDSHTLGLTSVQLARHDVAVGISHSGRTDEIVAALWAAKGRRAATIALTNDPDSPVSEAADIVLLTGAAETPLASEAGTSRVVQLAAVDALCARIILMRQQHLASEESLGGRREA